MGIELRQGMYIATIVGQHYPESNLMGKKAVFFNGRLLESNADIFKNGEVQKQLAERLRRTEFQVCTIKNPEQNEKEVNIIIDPCMAPLELIILGGGHIAQPLAALGKMLDYKVTVIDDREELISEDRYPQADVRLYCSFNELGKFLFPGPNSHVVIVTRGHQHDWTCLRFMLGFPLSYLGVIGSRKKIGMLKEKVISEGYTERDYERVHMPIGIDIGAQTPEEIAVSIAAELIKNRRGGSGASLNSIQNMPAPVRTGEATGHAEGKIMQKAVETACSNIDAAMATIITSTGSTPRKAGSRMLVFQDGSIYGTVGGGSGEAIIIKEALKVIKSDKPQMLNITMNADAAAEDGMVCGGSMEVLVEPVSTLAQVLCGREEK